MKFADCEDIFFCFKHFCEQNKFCATNIPVKYAHGCTYKLNTDYITLTLDVSLQLQMSSYNGKSSLFVSAQQNLIQYWVIKVASSL